MCEFQTIAPLHSGQRHTNRAGLFHGELLKRRGNEYHEAASVSTLFDGATRIINDFGSDRGALANLYRHKTDEWS